MKTHSSIPLVGWSRSPLFPHQATPTARAGAGRAPHRSVFFACALAACVLAGSAGAQTDDFNDGDDVGWNRIDPLRGLGVGGTGIWSFPNGAYRIQAVPALPTPYGPARAGSLHDSIYLGRFYVAVDIVDWDNSLNQIFGILTRVNNLGLGTTSGYALTYATRTGSNPMGEVEIQRITGEQNSRTLAQADYSFLPGQRYRMVFIGDGPNFIGKVFSVTNLATPLLTLSGSDATYTAGNVAIFTYDNSSSGANAADTTFDNFLAAPSEPPRLNIALLWGQVTVTWPLAAEGYTLQRADAIPSGPWTDVTTGILPDPDTGLYYYYPDTPGFFRLKWP